MRKVIEPVRFIDATTSYGEIPMFKKRRVLLKVDNMRIISFMSFDGQHLYIYPQRKWAFFWLTRSYGKVIKTLNATPEHIMSIAHDQMKSLLEERANKKKAEEFLNGQAFPKMNKVRSWT